MKIQMQPGDLLLERPQNEKGFWQIRRMESAGNTARLGHGYLNLSFAEQAADKIAEETKVNIFIEVFEQLQIKRILYKGI